MSVSPASPANAGEVSRPAATEETGPVPVASGASQLNSAPAIAQAPLAPVVAAPPQSAADSHCHSVAKARADDAAANGLDADTQRIVRDGTYANCMAWAASHGWRN